jgi:flavin-dependent dehydrogenase
MADVLVLGGGPAGAVAATILARAGARVRLLERARFPREKLCGDTLNPGALALLDGLGLAAAATRDALPVEGMIVSGGRVRIAAPYPAGATGRAIRRRDLDAALLEAAAAAGVDIEDGVVATGPCMAEARGGSRVAGVTVRRRTHREDARVTAPLTIAADGRRSRLAFALGLARHPRRPRRWAIGAYFDGVPGLTRFGEMHIRAGRYLGVAAVPGGLANACLVVESPHGLSDPSRALIDMLRSDPATADRFSRARLCGPASGVGPLAVDVDVPGAPGVLLAGDAAGFIDPMTGDGLRFAIAGAMLAARAARGYFEGRIAEPYRALAAWRRAAFHGKWRFNRTLRLLVARPTAIRAASLGARLAPSAIELTVAYAGDVWGRGVVGDYA